MEYKLYHYNMDGFNDIGFGCSYRNLQTILSCYKYYYNKSIIIPDIDEILYYFHNDYIDKINGDRMSLWIEPYQVSQYLQKYNINSKNILYLINDNDSCKLLTTDIKVYNRIYRKSDFDNIINMIDNHFENTKLPIIFDDGVYSYCVCKKNNNLVLISDPHIITGDTTYQKDLSFLREKTWMIYFPINY